MSDSTNISKEGEEPIQRNMVQAIGDWFYDLFNIRKGLDWIGTVTSIRNKVTLEGENMWMLVCSIMIASVGLNLNSGAVIIGAMLISPLMSPILGVGLGIAINDRELLIKAVKNFSIATVFAIITSVIYFKFLTPFKEAGSEIISRTQPTILDAIVAIFGGTAGIVASSRKDKGAAIPGVAIATALLPPLAVSGYGLANGVWHYFTHALYLFFLNSVLIALATFLVVRFLGFPMKEFQSKKGKRNATIVITLFVVAMLVPGVLILSQLIKEKERKEQVSDFFEKHFDRGSNQMYGMALLDSDPTSDTLVYKVSYRGVEIDSTQLALFEQELSEIEGKVTLIDPTLLNLTKEQLAKLENKTAIMDKTLKEKTNQEVIYQHELETLKAQIDSLSQPKITFSTLEKEIEALWPQIEKVSYAEAFSKNYKDTTYSVEPKVLVTWTTISSKEKKVLTEQLKRFLLTKDGIEHVEVISLN